MSTRKIIIEIGVETDRDDFLDIVDVASVDLGRLTPHMSHPQRMVVESILSDAAVALVRTERREARNGR